MSREDAIAKIESGKVIAIVRDIFGDDCLRLAQALCEGGISLMETPFDPCDPKKNRETISTIRLLTEKMGGKMLFGAGTITTVEMVTPAKEAGADFIVSPNTNEKVIRATLEKGMVSIPGAFTPTEIKFAHDCGGDFIKVFPACDLGVSYFKNIHAPLGDCKLLAFGGVNESNLGDYMNAGAMGAGVASCLFHKDWIKARDWQKITDAAYRISTIANS